MNINLNAGRKITIEQGSIKVTATHKDGKPDSITAEFIEPDWQLRMMAEVFGVKLTIDAKHLDDLIATLQQAREIQGGAE